MPPFTVARLKHIKKKDSDIWEEYGRMFWVFFEGDQNDLSQGWTNIGTFYFLYFFSYIIYIMMNEKCHISNVYRFINPAHPPEKAP